MHVHYVLTYHIMSITINVDSSNFPTTFDKLETAVSDEAEWICELNCHGYFIHNPFVLEEYNICQFIVPGGSIMQLNAESDANHSSESDLTESYAKHSSNSSLTAENRNKQYSFLSSWNGSNFKFDPTLFNGVEDRHKIKNYILEQCLHAGFKAEAKVRQFPPSKKQSKPSKIGTILFTCELNKTPIAPQSDETRGKNNFITYFLCNYIIHILTNALYY